MCCVCTFKSVSASKKCGAGTLKHAAFGFERGAAPRYVTLARTMGEINEQKFEYSFEEERRTNKLSYSCLNCEVYVVHVHDCAVASPYNLQKIRNLTACESIELATAR